MDVRSARWYVLGAATLWSISGVVTKSIDLDGPSIAVYRGLFAGLALLPFVPRAAMRLPWRLVPLIVAFGAMTGMYISAIKYTTAANAIFLQCTAPMWVVPLSWLFLGERPTRRDLLGIAVGMLGVLLIVARGYEGKPGEGFGVMLALGSGVGYAGVMVGLRGMRHIEPIWLSSVNNLGGALVLALGLVLFGMPPALPSAGQAVGLLAFGVVQMAIPYVLFARGLRGLPAAEAGLLGLLEPVLNPIWVWLFVGEAPAEATIQGGLLLLVGVAARYLPVRRIAKSPPNGSDAPAAKEGVREGS